MVPFHSGMSTCLLRSPVHASHEAWKWGQKQRKDTERCLLSFRLAAAVCCNWISLPKHKANVPSSNQRLILPGFRDASCVMNILIQFLLGRDSWAVASPWKVDSSLSWGSSGWFLRICCLVGGRFFFLLFFSFSCLRPLRHVLLAVCMLLGSVYVSSCHCPNIWAKVLQKRDSGIVSGSKHVSMLCSFLWQRYCDLGGRRLMLKW